MCDILFSLLRIWPRCLWCWLHLVVITHSSTLTFPHKYEFFRWEMQCAGIFFFSFFLSFRHFISFHCVLYTAVLGYAMDFLMPAQLSKRKQPIIIVIITIYICIWCVLLLLLSIQCVDVADVDGVLLFTAFFCFYGQVFLSFSMFIVNSTYI